MKKVKCTSPTSSSGGHLYTNRSQEITRAIRRKHQRLRQGCCPVRRLRIGTAGTPTTTAPAGTFRVTTAFAPTVAPSPIVTPLSTTAPRPIHTSLPIVIGLPRCPASRIGTPGARWWFESRMLAYSPIIVPEPIVIPAIATRCTPRESTTPLPREMVAGSCVSRWRLG